MLAVIFFFMSRPVIFPVPQLSLSFQGENLVKIFHSETFSVTGKYFFYKKKPDSPPLLSSLQLQREKENFLSHPYEEFNAVAG